MTDICKINIKNEKYKKILLKFCYFEKCDFSVLNIRTFLIKRQETNTKIPPEYQILYLNSPILIIFNYLKNIFFKIADFSPSFLKIFIY